EHVRHVVHLFLDGRDMPPRSALELLPAVEAPVATIQGRYWAMDRDKRWHRTKRAWDAIVDAKAPPCASPADAVRECYADPKCGDELMEPRLVGKGARVEDGDAVYFFNVGREEPFKGEDRVLVPSPRVATYDLQPEMSASGVAGAITKAIASKTYDFAIVNYANPDMVGHTGDIAATERAMAATDDA